MFACKHGILGFFLALVFGAACIPEAALSQSAQALFEKAFELMQRSDLATAEAFLRRGLAADPNNALGHYYLAEALTRQNRSRDEAAEHYRRASQIAPESKEGLEALAKVTRIEAEQKKVAGWREPIVKSFWSAAKVRTVAHNKLEGEGQIICAWLLPKSKISFKNGSLDVASVEVFVGAVTGIGRDDAFRTGRLSTRQYSEYVSKVARWSDSADQPNLIFENFDYLSGRRLDRTFKDAKFIHFARDRKTVFWIEFDFNASPYIYTATESGGCMP